MKNIIIILLCYCYTSYAYSSAAPTLQLYTETFPPYSYLSGHEVVGINSEIVQQTCALAAIKCHIKLLPWNRAIALTKKYRFSGIYSMSRNQAREKNYKWVGPLVASENYFYRLKSRTDIKVSNLASAAKYSLAVPRNDVYEKLLKARGFKNLLQVSNKFQGVKLFIAGKIDLLIASPVTLSHQLAEQGIDPSRLEKLIHLPVPELQGNYLALHPDIGQKYVSKLQKALNQLHSSGKVAKIITQYEHTDIDTDTKP